jgi:hypothetical protein
MSSLIRGRGRDKRGRDNERDRLVAGASWTAVPRERECRKRGSRRGAHEREKEKGREEQLIDTHDVDGAPSTSTRAVLYTCALLLVTATSEVPVMGNEWRGCK